MHHEQLHSHASNTLESNLPGSNPEFPQDNQKPIKPDPETPYQPTEPAEPDVQPDIIGDN